MLPLKERRLLITLHGVTRLDVTWHEMAWRGQALRAATERGVDRAKGMAEGERVPFFACGLSSVMHPKVR